MKCDVKWVNRCDIIDICTSIVQIDTKSVCYLHIICAGLSLCRWNVVAQ